MKRESCVKPTMQFYGENATIHGIGAIHNSPSKLRKFGFSVLFLCLFCSLVYAAYFSIHSFLERQVFTSIEKMMQSRIEFPSVTVCRNGESTISDLPEGIVNRTFQKLDEIKAGKVDYSNFSEFVQNISLEIRVALENSNQSTPKQPPMILEGIEEACLFASRESCNLTRDFKQTYGAGSCYTFHGNEEKTHFQAENGPYFGLQLMLYVNESNYLPLIQTKDGAGFTIYVHERGTIPLLGIGGILVAPGTLSRISIYKSETISLPHPFRTNCSDGKGVENFFPGPYSSLSCLATCFFKRVFEECGYEHPLIKGKMTPEYRRPKVTLDMLKCESRMRNKFLESISYLRCDCPKPCKEVVYESRISNAKWPVDGDVPYYTPIIKSILGLHSKNLSGDYFSKNFLTVKIYFDELSVIRFITKELISKMDLISNIGGHLGFWCGASVFSLVEGIVFIGTVLYFAFRSKSASKVKDDRGSEVEAFDKTVIKVKSEQEMDSC